VYSRFVSWQEWLAWPEGNTCRGSQQEPDGTHADGTHADGTHAEGTHAEGTHAEGSHQEPDGGALFIQSLFSAKLISDRQWPGRYTKKGLH
jgi:hypothetical protein